MKGLGASIEAKKTVKINQMHHALSMDPGKKDILGAFKAAGISQQSETEKKIDAIHHAHTGLVVDPNKINPSFVEKSDISQKH